MLSFSTFPTLSDASLITLIALMKSVSPVKTKDPLSTGWLPSNLPVAPPFFDDDVRIPTLSLSLHSLAIISKLFAQCLLHQQITACVCFGVSLLTFSFPHSPSLISALTKRPHPFTGCHHCRHFFLSDSVIESSSKLT